MLQTQFKYIISISTLQFAEAKVYHNFLASTIIILSTINRIMHVCTFKCFNINLTYLDVNGLHWLTSQILLHNDFVLALRRIREMTCFNFNKSVQNAAQIQCPPVNIHAFKKSNIVEDICRERAAHTASHLPIFHCSNKTKDIHINCIFIRGLIYFFQSSNDPDPAHKFHSQFL